MTTARDVIAEALPLYYMKAPNDDRLLHADTILAALLSNGFHLLKPDERAGYALRQQYGAKKSP